MQSLGIFYGATPIVEWWAPRIDLVCLPFNITLLIYQERQRCYEIEKTAKEQIDQLQAEVRRIQDDKLVCGIGKTFHDKTCLSHFTL